MEKYFSKSLKSSAGSSSTNDPNLNSSEETSGSKRKFVDFNSNDIEVDPGIRKSIDEYDANIRDLVKRAYLTRGPFQPVLNFPKTQMGSVRRSFQKDWYKDFNWLEYSRKLDKAYCFYCYLFGGRKSNAAFRSAGFNNWKNALATFRDHVAGGHDSVHNEAVARCNDFENQRQSISHKFVAQSQENEVAYRKRLTAILKVVRLLLKQGLAFRGHDESLTSSNKGNFLEILDFYCDENVEVAKILRENAPENNKLIAPKVQRELVHACAMETRMAIIADIGDHLFSLMVDESRDNSNKEQMAIVLRYVNNRGEVIERFLTVEHVQDTSSQSLKNVIDSVLATYNLSYSRLRGQGYDGASNMRGQFNGLQALISKEQSCAPYVHCFAHQLQLVVVAVAKGIPEVNDFFTYLSQIVNVVGGSCKRKDALSQSHHDKLIANINSGETSTGRGKNQATTLARPGDTRWGSHYVTLLRLYEMWDSVLDVLQDLYEDDISTDQKGLVNGLIGKLESFQFVFIMHLMIDILATTNDLSQALQLKTQNIANAVCLITTVKSQLQSMREVEWDSFLEKVTKFCVNEQDNRKISVPNFEEFLPLRGRSRREGQTITYFHRYKVEIFNAAFDLIYQEMNSRFTETSSELLLCIACLDPRDQFSRFDRDRLVRLAELYPNDFSSTDRMMLYHQMRVFIQDVRSCDDFSGLRDIGELSVKMVKTEKSVTFSFVYKLIELALVLPVATATVERVFSAMNLIKTNLRNKLGNEFMSDTLVVYIERDIFNSIEDEAILQRYQKMGNRRYQLSRSTDSSTNVGN